MAYTLSYNTTVSIAQGNGYSMNSELVRKYVRESIIHSTIKAK
jgi:hypothetical protein